MFSGAATAVERPAGWRSNSHSYGSLSAYNSPNGSRRSSVSSVASAQTDPGLVTDRSRASSTASTATAGSSKSGFRSIFGKKEKKPKEKDGGKIVLTSRHAATVKTKMMTDPRYKNKAPVKTAEVVGTIKSGHLTAAQQEARHPHSGPPTIHVVNDMPTLTRIISGDERDDEDEYERLERARSEWEMAKATDFTRIHEHDSRPASPVQPGDESSQVVHGTAALSPVSETAPHGNEIRRPSSIARNSYGGRFRKDANGNWTR